MKDKPSCGNGSAGRFVLRCRQRFSGLVPGPFCGSPALFRDVPEPLRERRGSLWGGAAAWIFCRWEQAAFPRMRQKSRKRYGRVLQTGSPSGGFPAVGFGTAFRQGFSCAALRGFIRTGLPAVTRSAIGFGRLSCGKRRHGGGIAPALRGGKEVGLLFGRSGPCSFREDAF